MLVLFIILEELLINAVQIANIAETDARTAYHSATPNQGKSLEDYTERTSALYIVMEQAEAEYDEAISKLGLVSSVTEMLNDQFDRSQEGTRTAKVKAEESKVLYGNFKLLRDLAEDMQKSLWDLEARIIARISVLCPY